MIDIHTHVVFGVDDGPSTIKEALRMVLEAEKNGVNSIIATPHFHEGLYHPEQVDEHFRELVTRTEGCGVKLHLGYEVFLTSSLCDNVNGLDRLLLGNTRYLLFELPFDNLPMNSADMLYKLHVADILPVLAHPERFRYFYKNLDTLIGFMENGCLLQIDAASIIGVYGTEIRNFVKRLVKMDMVHFAASDAHCADDYSQWLTEAFNTIKHWAGEEYARRIFEENPGLLLDNGN